MKLTLANWILEAADAIDELPVLLETFLLGRDGIGWTISQV